MLSEHPCAGQSLFRVIDRRGVDGRLVYARRAEPSPRVRCLRKLQGSLAPRSDDRRAVRRLRVILLATLVVALPARGADPAPRVKNTRGEIESIAMDGARVAYAVKS